MKDPRRLFTPVGILEPRIAPAVMDIVTGHGDGNTFVVTPIVIIVTLIVTQAGGTLFYEAERCH